MAFLVCFSENIETICFYVVTLKVIFFFVKIVGYFSSFLVVASGGF